MSLKSHSLIQDAPPREASLERKRSDLTADEGRSGYRERDVAKLRLVWDERRFLFRAAVLGLIFSTVIAFLIPKHYKSTSRLMPPDDQSSSGLAMAAAALSGRSSGLGGIASDLLGLKSTSDIFVGILGSRTTSDKIIQQFDLRRVYHDRTFEDARKDLEDRTTVTVDRKSQIIKIDVVDKSAQRATAIGQAYIEELNRLVADLSTSSARRERIFLEQRLQQVNKDLERAEDSFSQFASRNVAIDVPAQGRAMVEAAAALQGQLIAAQSELEGLRQIYSDNNVRVRSTSARVAELQAQLEKLGGKTEASADSTETAQSMYPSIRKLPLLGVQYADLYRKTKVEEAVFETLTQQYELAKVQEAKEIPTVKVLDPPDLPEKKSFPPRFLIVLLGTMLAFSVGLTWIFSAKIWETTDPNDPGKLFAQEVFHTVKASMPWVSLNGSSVGRPIDKAEDSDSGSKMLGR